jgi:hypothetical protein
MRSEGVHRLFGHSREELSCRAMGALAYFAGSTSQAHRRQKHSVQRASKAADGCQTPLRGGRVRVGW